VISQRAAWSVWGEKSRMKREFHVRFCEGVGVQFPCATRLATDRRQETVEPARIGKARSRSRTGRSEESDGCIVPMKPRTTPADRRVAESVEGRRPVEGRAKANACSGHRAGTRMSPTACTHGPELEPKPRTPVASDLRQEPGADTEGAAKQKAARRDLRGGQEVTPAPTATGVRPCFPPFRADGDGRRGWR
jgi:hypothetical protein